MKRVVQRIAYLGVVCDLFHYGHLRSIQFAKSISDYLICGVFTDEAVESYRVRPIANYEERKAVVESILHVDMVMVQEQRDPTQNLQLIHQEFPDAEIILVHGDDLNHVHGDDYVNSIGGKIVKHPYYPRLSNFKIVRYFLENKNEFKDIAEFTSFINGQQPPDAEVSKGNKIIISSKADTLKALRPLLTQSRIEPLYNFTISEWKNEKEQVVGKIQEMFSPEMIVVRSSAVQEDTLDKSMAGCFESVLSVNSGEKKEVEAAIDKVFRSYKEKDAETSFNQILIQRQTNNILMGGVVFTRTLTKNGPYYVINYDDTTGSTNSVTAGRENKTIYISRFASQIPEEMAGLVDAVKEIEDIIPTFPLDIEFAVQKDGGVVIFQVRPLAANRHKEKADEKVREAMDSLKSSFKKHALRQPHLCGGTTFFGDMPDWNPAEIIGDRPNLLDYSLYDYIITNSAWHEARSSQGYYDVNPAKLVELFGDKPYVNVRNTFNSFTPAAVSPQLREKLVSFYLEKLCRNPHLQDKVEFEVLYTCFDLTFGRRSGELKEAGFSREEIAELRNALLDMTNRLIIDSPQSIENDMNSVFSLEESRKAVSAKAGCGVNELITQSKTLIDQCRKNGTVQFSRLARLGFIAKIIFKSMVAEGIVAQDFYDAKYMSIKTIATKIKDDFNRLMKGEISKTGFIEEYYHLRPGTYDLTSPRYGANPELINSFQQETAEEENCRLDIREREKDLLKIDAALRENGLQFDAQQFMDFVDASTKARELSKFEFTKNLSDALELLAEAGEQIGFTRKEVAMLDINEIFSTGILDKGEIIPQWKRLVQKHGAEKEAYDLLVLPPLIFSEKDLEIVRLHKVKPNFITSKSIESRIVLMDSLKDKIAPDLQGCIVVLENGDPGYDWIFTRNPAGLITKYGGVASHMSIRCAEFGIPAAIGCGELIFNMLKNAERVKLDCKSSTITAIGGKSP